MKIKDDFLKSLLFITFPIVLQSLLTTAVGSADVLMLSYVNQTSLSAVSLANQVQFVLNLGCRYVTISFRGYSRFL